MGIPLGSFWRLPGLGVWSSRMCGHWSQLGLANKTEPEDEEADLVRCVWGGGGARTIQAMAPVSTGQSGCRVD